MRRVLTGYAQGFNRRHKRHGRLFQNRYKSILCQEQIYLLELVRYIHLNPLRAGIVPDLKALGKYPFTGHSRIMGKISDGWQETDKVLGLFDSKKSSAMRRYYQFVEKGISNGRKPELTGGGLLRSAGGWKVLKALRKMEQHFKGDERILGDSDFVQSVLDQAQEQLERSYQLKTQGFTIDMLIARVSDIFNLPVKYIITASKEPLRVKARSVAAYWAVKELNMEGTEVGRKLNLTQSAVSRAVRRGEGIVNETGLSIDGQRNA